MSGFLDGLGVALGVIAMCAVPIGLVFFAFPPIRYWWRRWNRRWSRWW